MVDEMKRALEGAQNIALVCHISPDMDTLGSAAGLRFVLEKMGKRVTIYDQDPVPERYLFVGGLGDVRLPDEEVYDLCVSIDVSDRARMGEAARVFDNARARAMIDHHKTTEPFAPVHVVRPDAAATAEILTKLFDEYGWEIPQKAALCLCAGISTDTGNFSFASVTGDTLRAAARCVECGAKMSVITESLYRTSTEGHIRAMGRILNGLDLRADGRIAVMSVTLQDKEELSLLPEDSEGIVNFGLEIKGVQAAVLLNEREGLVKCSLRAKEPLDVAKVAAEFGGGGHVLAAGCSFEKATMEEAREKIVRALERHGLTERTDFISFSLNACLEYRKRLPEANVYYLAGDLSPESLRRVALTGLDYSAGVLRQHPEWIEQAHRAGLEVNVWTVNSEEEMRYFIAQGVDYITTDYPERLQALLRE